MQGLKREGDRAQAKGDDVVRRVLLVDSRPEVARERAQMLRQAGLEAVVTADVQEATRCLEAAPFNSVVVVLHPSDAGGVELCRRVRAHPPQSLSLLLAVIDARDSSLLSSALEAGADAIVPAHRLTHVLTRFLSDGGGVDGGVRIADHAVSPRASQLQETPLHIVVADDNVVHQTMIARQLENEGYRVSLAAAGSQVMAMVGRDRVDVLLLDARLPEMDILVAAGAIRETDGTIAIIAMTASHTSADGERFEAAGIDVCIAKPVEVEKLLTMIASMRKNRPPHTTAVKELARTGIVDIDASLQRMDGDRELLATLAGLFIDKMNGVISTLDTAMTESDFRTMERTAHSLRGSASNFSARDTIEAARQLEIMGRNHNLDGAAVALADLKSAMAQLKPYLEPLRSRQ